MRVGQDPMKEEIEPANNSWNKLTKMETNQ
jgi:hypothetical protein